MRLPPWTIFPWLRLARRNQDYLALAALVGLVLIAGLFALVGWSASSNLDTPTPEIVK